MKLLQGFLQPRVRLEAAPRHRLHLRRLAGPPASLVPAAPNLSFCLSPPRKARLNSSLGEDRLLGACSFKDGRKASERWRGGAQKPPSLSDGTPLSSNAGGERAAKSHISRLSSSSGCAALPPIRSPPTPLLYKFLKRIFLSAPQPKEKRKSQNRGGESERTRSSGKGRGERKVIKRRGEGKRTACSRPSPRASSQGPRCGGRTRARSLAPAAPAAKPSPPTPQK